MPLLKFISCLCNVWPACRYIPSNRLKQEKACWLFFVTSGGESDTQETHDDISLHIFFCIPNQMSHNGVGKSKHRQPLSFSKSHMQFFFLPGTIVKAVTFLSALANLRRESQDYAAGGMLSD